MEEAAVQLMRIVAGKYRSRILKRPNGSGLTTSPASDKPMRLPLYSLIVASNFQSSPVLYYSRKALLSVIFAMGAWMLYSAFHNKRFHFRGGRPMPPWWGRLSSFLTGVFIIWAVVHFWNL